MTYRCTLPPAANCCSPPASCSPGRICRAPRAPKAAIRACWSIVLRGALDGLATVAPVGDPDWVRLRGDKALTLDGATPALPLDNFFALNPAMPNLHRMYKAGQASIVHAVASPYRERSHFDGQDVLESGLTKPGSADTGWLNRALASLQPAGRVGGKEAFAVGPVTPLVVRGPAPVLSWTPPQAAAGDRRHRDAAARSLSPHRSGAGARAGGARRSRRDRARRRHGA